MIERYGVERFDSVTYKQVKEIGFTSELLGFLEGYKISKDEVVETFERGADENQTLETAIDEILQNREQAKDSEPATEPAPEPALEAAPETSSLPTSEATAE